MFGIQSVSREYLASVGFDKKNNNNKKNTLQIVIEWLTQDKLEDFSMRACDSIPLFISSLLFCIQFSVFFFLFTLFALLDHYVAFMHIVVSLIYFFLPKKKKHFTKNGQGSKLLEFQQGRDKISIEECKKGEKKMKSNLPTICESSENNACEQQIEQ